MSVPKKYDPKDCVTTINGSYAVTGYASDMITGSRDNDSVSFTEGAQGDTVANLSASTLGTITLTLLATSPSNAVLVDLAKKKEFFSIWINNKSIGERMGGTQAMVVKYPDYSYGSTVGNRAYTIKVVDFDVDNAKIL